MPAISRISPVNQTIYWDRSGSVPSVTSLVVSIIEAPEIAVEFVQFYIERISGNIDWLTSEDLGEYIPVTGGTIPLNLFNLDSLYPGNFQSKVDVFLSNSGGEIRQLTAYINLNITGEPPVVITTDQENYNVIYQRSNNSFTGETTVAIVNNSALNNISVVTTGTLLLEKTFTDAFTLEEDPAFPFSSNTELPLNGTVIVNCRLKKDGIFIYSFTVTIIVMEDDEIIAFPKSFEFLLRKGYNETKSAILNLTNPFNHAFTITKPAWLNLSVISGSATASINLETVNSDTLTVGEFTENIVISYDGKTINIPVKLTVITFIDINVTEHNFCLDNIFLNVRKMNETAKFVRITMKMKFKTSKGETVLESPYQVPYFQDKVKTDIGRKIQNYFPIFSEHLFDSDSAVFDNQFIYKAAEVILKVEELDINYVVLLTNTTDAADFFAGNRPKQFPLFTNFPMRRKYEGSTFFFSYLTDILSAEDFSPGTVNENPTAAKEVHAVMMTDAGIIDYATIETNLGLDIIAFPDQNRQNFIQWLNNNLVPEWFVFSGKYKLTDDFEHIYDAFQIDGQKYDTTEIQKLTIETGFVLKEESLLIKEIIKSKISFIKLEGEIYRSFCISTKLVELEAELNLINYELEFLIVK